MNKYNRREEEVKEVGKERESKEGEQGEGRAREEGKGEVRGGMRGGRRIKNKTAERGGHRKKRDILTAHANTASTSKNHQLNGK